MKTRIRKKTDVYGKPYYVIDEVVTKQGYYITWSGIYVTVESAAKEIEMEKSIRNRKGK